MTVGDVVTLATAGGPVLMRVEAVRVLSDGFEYVNARALDGSWAVFMRADAFTNHERGEYEGSTA